MDATDSTSQPDSSPGRLDPDVDWQQIVENSPDFIMSAARDGTILYINRTVPGYELEQVIGTSAYAYVPESARDAMRTHVERVFETGDSDSFEIAGLDADGSTSWYFSSIGPVIRAGEVVAATIVTRDITDRRRAEVAMRDAYEREREAVERLRRLDEMQSEFVAGVVHDLRTPITIIGGFASTLLERREILDETQREEFLRLISDGAGRLTDLVDDILSIAYLESGEFTTDITPFDLGGSICTAIGNLGPAADRVHIDMGVEPPLMALGDERRHQQVILNLVSNALKYSPPDSPIDVRVAVEDDAVRVEVVDRGVGIEEDDIPRLFRKFSQVGDADQSGTPGSGLGLYICRTLLEAQSGTIEVHSELGEGTTFAYRLPRAGDGEGDEGGAAQTDR